MSVQKLTRVSLSATMMLVLLLSMLAPVGLVFAQDGSPPADPPPTEEVGADDEVGDDESSLEEEPVAEEPGAADAALEEDSSSDLAGAAGTDEQQPAEESQDDAEAVEPEEASQDEAGEADSNAEAAVDEEPTAEEAGDEGLSLEATEEENPVAEAVQALDEADVVLLDEEGEALSMATQEAADALTAPDPQFCPAGLSYGDVGCGTSHNNMADAIQDALDAATNSGISGTIFVDAGSFTGFTLSGFTFGTSLTIQGNANNGGTTNYTSAVVVDNSNTGLNLTFNDVTFDAGVSVDGVTGDLSFNDVVAEAASGDAITVSNHDGAVSLDNVTANNTGTASNGANINNEASGSNEAVTITDSNFNNFDNNGLIVQSAGEITLSGVTANDNGDEGATLSNTFGPANAIKVFGSTFNNNGTNGTASGLLINSAGTITLSHVTADNNTGDGVTLNSGAGTGPENIVIKCSTLTNNGGNGFTADANGGDLGLYSVTTGGNTNAFATTNVTNITFQTINCDPSEDDGVKHPRDGKNVECNTDGPTTLELELYAHSITFPPMDISGCNGFARSLFNDAELPGELPEDSEFLRGLSIHLEGCELPDDAAMSVGFEIPAAEQDNEFAVLFWDNQTDTWIEVPGMLTADGRYTVSWPITGNFVLVTK